MWEVKICKYKGMVQGTIQEIQKPRKRKAVHKKQVLPHETLQFDLQLSCKILAHICLCSLQPPRYPRLLECTPSYTHSLTITSMFGVQLATQFPLIGHRQLFVFLKKCLKQYWCVRLT